MGAFLNVNMNVDYKDFYKALKFYARAVEYEMPKAINHQSGNFIFKVTKNVPHPVAHQSRIIADTRSLYNEQLTPKRGKNKRYRTMNRLVGMTFAYAKPRPNSNSGKSRIAINWGGKPSRQVMGEAIRKVVNIRTNAAGYILRGWRQLGPMFGVWDKTKEVLNGNQRKIGGTVAYKATIEKMWSFMRNGAKGAGTVSQDSVDKALAMTITDFVTHAHKKIREKAKESRLGSTN
jgi:hypothetical protein